MWHLTLDTYNNSTRLILKLVKRGGHRTAPHLTVLPLSGTDVIFSPHCCFCCIPLHCSHGCGRCVALDNEITGGMLLRRVLLRICIQPLGHSRCTSPSQSTRHTLEVAASGPCKSTGPCCKHEAQYCLLLEADFLTTKLFSKSQCFAPAVNNTKELPSVRT